MKNQKGNPYQMKPNELRIGNLVYENESTLTPRKIGLIGANFVHLGAAGFFMEVEAKDILPIPLTEKLLLKCGFESVSHFTVVNSHTIGLGRGRVLSIGDTENANQMAWIQSVDGSTVTDLICVHNFDYEGKMHLHQLQNLYFALTGEELKIEL